MNRLDLSVTFQEPIAKTNYLARSKVFNATRLNRNKDNMSVSAACFIRTSKMPDPFEVKIMRGVASGLMMGTSWGNYFPFCLAAFAIVPVVADWKHLGLTCQPRPDQLRLEMPRDP